MMRGEREVEKNGQGTRARERKKRRLIALASPSKIKKYFPFIPEAKPFPC